MERRLCTLIYLCNVFCIFIELVILIKHTKSQKYIYKKNTCKNKYAKGSEYLLHRYLRNVLFGKGSLTPRFFADLIGTLRERVVRLVLFANLGR